MSEAKVLCVQIAEAKASLPQTTHHHELKGRFSLF